MNTMNLQRFADDSTEAGTQEIEKQSDQSASESAKYTDEDLDRIINQKFAKWAADRDKAVEDARKEGEKLAKMNADQKQAYALEQANKELDSLKAQIEQYKAQEARAELRKNAAAIFSKDYKLNPTEEILDLVVGKDADSTNANIQKMAAALQAERQAAEKARATGVTPFGTSANHQPADPFQKKLDKWKR